MRGHFGGDSGDPDLAEHFDNIRAAVGSILARIQTDQGQVSFLLSSLRLLLPCDPVTLRCTQSLLAAVEFC